ncbi:ribosome maturation factor RimM [Brevundimonas sp. 2R-24]|uniref:Ribosome maturation factor RimM n=1 Tax=Peiella sedimenti TaxID=3061083 RepID=A0ABT8SLH5_9CAUL|nr:ribosome maturation factor RimM [Caulobacteraceae bacterium XZ-24]
MSDERDPLILVGRVAGAFGVRGEVRLSAYTADPLAVAAYGPLLNDAGRPVLTLESSRRLKANEVAARAAEVETREQAEALRGLNLHVRRSTLPPPDDEDEFYLADLIGLEARSPEGEALGQVKAVQNFGAGDILEIAPAEGGPTWYLPFTRAAVPEVRIAEGWLTAVRPEESESGPAETS